MSLGSGHPAALPAAATATGGAIVELMFAKVRAGASTLVLITHDPELAAQCDRIIEMRDGKIVHDSADAAVTA